MGRHSWLCVAPYLSASLPLHFSPSLKSYYLSFSQNRTPHFCSQALPPLHLPCFLPFSLPLSFSSLLIFKSHMLPARLAQLHPANEGLFIGLRLSAAKQGLVGAEAGASSAAHNPLPLPLLLHRQLHMPVVVWPCRPEADYLSLLSLIADSSWKEPGGGGRKVLACWTVTWQAWTQRFVFLLSNSSSALVAFIKMDVVFIKCWWEVTASRAVPSMQRMERRWYEGKLMDCVVKGEGGNFAWPLSHCFCCYWIPCDLIPANNWICTMTELWNCECAALLNCFYRLCEVFWFLVFNHGFNWYSNTLLYERTSDEYTNRELARGRGRVVYFISFGSRLESSLAADVFLLWIWPSRHV